MCTYRVCMYNLERMYTPVPDPRGRSVHANYRALHFEDDDYGGDGGDDDAVAAVRGISLRSREYVIFPKGISSKYPAREGLYICTHTYPAIGFNKVNSDQFSRLHRTLRKIVGPGTSPDVGELPPVSDGERERKRECRVSRAILVLPRSNFRARPLGVKRREREAFLSARVSPRSLGIFARCGWESEGTLGRSIRARSAADVGDKFVKEAVVKVGVVGHIPAAGTPSVARALQPREIFGISLAVRGIVNHRN